MGLSGFGPEFPTPEAGRIPCYPTNPEQIFLCGIKIFDI